MRDYTGKKIYLGIDVHKKTYAVTAILEGQVIKKDTLPASPEKLLAYCLKYFPGAHIESAYEAGFSGFYLHRFLNDHKIQNHVIHAAGVEVATGDKIKTDKRDSLKLATQLSVGRLKRINVPTREQELKRNLTRFRDCLMKHRVRLGAQLKALLFLNALIPYEDDRRVSQKWIDGLKNLKMEEELNHIVLQYIDLWSGVTQKIKETDQQLKIQALKDEALEKVYRSVPGFGPHFARVLANELGDMSQFKSRDQLFSFTGMTPSQYSSGEHVRLGHITRQGRSVLRKVLIQASWVAIKHDDHLKNVFDRIAETQGAKRAIVAIGRRLIGHTRACFKKGELYKRDSIKLLETCNEINIETGEFINI